MISIRKLAALDMAFLGPALIITEFAVGVICPLALGSFIAVRSRSWQQSLIACYFAALGINYVPLLVYALIIRRRSRAHREIETELHAGKRETMRRYRRGSLLPLIPFAVPLVAVAQTQRARAGLSRTT